MQRKLVTNQSLLKQINYKLTQIKFFLTKTPPPPPLTTTIKDDDETPTPPIGCLSDTGDPLYADVPRPKRDKSERKPYVTPMKELIRRAKEEKEKRKLQPVRLLEHVPDNGLLVPDLIDVARVTYHARLRLLESVSRLLSSIQVLRCRFCSEIHVGHVSHEIRTCMGPGSGLRRATHVWRRGIVRDVIYFPKCFHLYDRVGKPRVGHKERHSVPRIPAIVELCIQAGLDLEKFQTKRRTQPVYSIDGRIVDFEEVILKEKFCMNLSYKDVEAPIAPGLRTGIDEEMKQSKRDRDPDYLKPDHEVSDLRDIGIKAMDSWFEMISGAKNIMEKYSVWTCGYCPEVQVGPKGHKVRMCKATKHQARDGQHAWQEATIDDLVGPNYVWHVRDRNGSPLENDLKRYYGKAPAVVELCVQAGAPVPDQYRSMMRLDVIPPDRDEVDLVA